MCMSIKGPRGCGKTTRILELANGNNGYVVTINTINARTLAKEHGFDNIKGFIDYREYVNNFEKYMRDRDYYYLDDIENFVKQIGNIGAYTSSID